jgi:hypothetical protein
MVPITPISTDSQIQHPPAAFEDPLEVQKKIMRQTRELAIKRRQEEEAREEAARKERIRLKLEAMGPPPESKKNKKDTPKEEKYVPTQIQSREAADKKSQDPATDTNPETTPNSEPISEEATKPLVDEEPEEKNSPPNTQSNGIHQHDASTNFSQDRSSQSWQNNSAQTSDRFRPWAPAPAQQPSSRNVWGPPSNDRTLGNGTFNPELSRLPDMRQQSHPGPIGPPIANRGSSQFQQSRGREPYAPRPGPIGPPNRDTGIEKNKAAVAASGWGSLPSKLAQDDKVRAQQQDIEIARKRELRESGMEAEVVGPVLQEKWRQVALNEDGTRGQIHSTKTTIHDPTQAWKSQSERPEENQSRTTFEDQQDSSQYRQIDPVGPHALHGDAWRSAPNLNNSTPPVRGSRFFPNHRDVRLEEQSNFFERPGSPSPPPPTTDGHPAYDGDVNHPLVSLPIPIVVKLPPPTVLAPIGPPKPISFAAAVQAPAVPAIPYNAGQARQDYPSRTAHMYQDIRRQEPTAGGWQDRINSLIGRKNSPPKSHALAVDSSSKNALELPGQQINATVSLPWLSSAGFAMDDGAVESKPPSEECFEEQEMGSLPIIKVPNQAPPSAWNLAPAPKPLPRKFVVMQVTSVEPFVFPQPVANNNAIFTIKLPGQDEEKTVSSPRRQESNPRRGGTRSGAPRNSSSSHRGARGRDASSGFSSPNHDNVSSSSSPASTSRGGRGGRGYGSSWNRHISTPVRT